jgi:hypothetical protein
MVSSVYKRAFLECDNEECKRMIVKKYTLPFKINVLFCHGKLLESKKYLMFDKLFAVRHSLYQINCIKKIKLR